MLELIDERWMIEFHWDFIRRKWWLEWNNWHCASDNQSMKNLSSKNILSFNRRDCNSQQSYSCFASKFCKDINKHLLSWKNCCSNDATYVINLQRWKWYKNHWLDIDSLNCASSYLWWIMTQHKWSWLNERSNDHHSHSCAVSDSALMHSIDLCSSYTQICEEASQI